MENKDVLEKLKVLKEKYPNINAIKIRYCGSGDSLEDMDFEVQPEYDINQNDFNDLLEELWERAGSDFNNEGGYGIIDIDLNQLSIKMEDYYYMTESELRTEFEIK